MRGAYYLLLAESAAANDVSRYSCIPCSRRILFTLYLLCSAAVMPASYTPSQTPTRYGDGGERPIGYSAFEYSCIRRSICSYT